MIAAATIAIGTSAGQVLDDVARTGLQAVLWHGPQGIGALGAGADFTFQLGWLAVALGAAAVAVVVGRTAPDPS